MRRLEKVVALSPMDRQILWEIAHAIPGAKVISVAREVSGPEAEILDLLLELEPGLSKYRATPYEGQRTWECWNLPEMRLAVQHLRGAAAARKFVEPVVAL